MNESEIMLVWKAKCNKSFERIMNDWKRKKMLNDCCEWWNERMKNVRMNVQNEMYVENVEKCSKCKNAESCKM